MRNRLVEGVHQFQSENFPQRQELFQELAKGQKPETLFITCSDSRIDPNLITGSQPGELFIVRNAGNIVPPHGANIGGEVATIEYAVASIGVKEIIVCGHSYCGAMTGLLHPEKITTLPAVEAWLGYAETTRRIIRDNYGHLEGAALLSATIEENVLVQLDNLRTLPAVASRLVKGDLQLHGWVYKIETGDVYAHDGVSGQFVKIAEYNPAAAVPRRKVQAV